MTMSELQDLKKALHPQLTINIVQQADIVTRALKNETIGTTTDLAQYLEMSPEWVRKIKSAHDRAIPELKEFFGKSNFKMSTYYREAAKSEEEQRAFLHGMHVITGNSSEQTVKEEGNE